MKTTHLFIFSFFLLLSFRGIAQQKAAGSTDTIIYKSKNGTFLSCSGVIRILVVLAEVNYDIGADSSTWATWKQGTFPSWGKNFVDVKGHRSGLFTRYFYEASSGNYQLLGDYLSPPTNNGVFIVNNSDIKSKGYRQALVNAINAQMTNGFKTQSGIKNLKKFDQWTPTRNGLPKIKSSNNSFDHVMVIWRNFTIANGTGNSHPGENLAGKILDHTTDSWSQFGAQDGMPLDIARHEFSHLIIGGNNFHVGGGREQNMWIGKNCAHSMLGLYGTVLGCWSGWDRQRLGWKGHKNKFLISARNEANKKEVSGDLDANNPDQAGIYTLRDFVSTGDAIRIKLPFLPAGAPRWQDV